LLRDTIKVSVHVGVIEGVDYGRLCLAACRCDLVADRFQSSLRSAGQKDSRTFCRKLPGDRRADRATGSEYNSVLAFKHPRVRPGGSKALIFNACIHLCHCFRSSRIGSFNMSTFEGRVGGHPF
jgi:hypothetical protein